MDLVFKVTYKDATRRLLVAKYSSWTDMKQQLRNRFSLPDTAELELKWDDEGDIITVSSPPEFADVLAETASENDRIARVTLVVIDAAASGPVPSAQASASPPEVLKAEPVAAVQTHISPPLLADDETGDDYDKVELLSESESENDEVVESPALDKGKARQAESIAASETTQTTNPEPIVAQPTSVNVDETFFVKSISPDAVPDPDDEPLPSPEPTADPVDEALPTAPAAGAADPFNLAHLLSSIFPPAAIDSFSAFVASPSQNNLEQLLRESPAVVGQIVNGVRQETSRVAELARAEAARVASNVRMEAETVRAEFERAKQEMENVRREFEAEVRRAAANVANSANQAQTPVSTATSSTDASSRQEAPAAPSQPSDQPSSPSPPSAGVPQRDTVRVEEAIYATKMPGSFGTPSMPRPKPPRAPRPPAVDGAAPTYVCGNCGQRGHMKTSKKLCPRWHEFNAPRSSEPYHIPGAYRPASTASTSRLPTTRAATRAELYQAVRELGFNPDKIGIRVACDRVWDRHRGESLDVMTQAFVDIVME